MKTLHILNGDSTAFSFKQTYFSYNKEYKLILLMDILQIKPEEELLRTLPFLVVKQENDNFIGITHRKNVVSTLI